MVLPPPCHTLTTNVVGGLGNQLFLVANLLATERRVAAALAGRAAAGAVAAPSLRAWLPRPPSSDSVFEPRPTYWRSLLRGVPLPAAPPPTPAAGAAPRVAVTVGERRPAAPVAVGDVVPAAAAASGAGVDAVLVGFFQSSLFFSDFPDGGDALRRLLRPDALSAAAHDTLVARHDPSRRFHLIGLHVRRGDYLRLQDSFCVLGHGYYDAAVRQLLGPALLHRRGGGSGHAKLLLFCEPSERPWARTMAGFFMAKYPHGCLAACEVVEATEAGPGPALLLPSSNNAASGGGDAAIGGGGGDRSTAMEPEVLELLMLSHCHDVVCANSSYSWWAAHFNETPLRRVVAPSRWFANVSFRDNAHMYEPDWIVL